MFQSTHPRGVRPLNAIKNYIESKFQSTHPRGVRHGIFSMLHWGLCFNPRTRVGCDLLVRATPTATDSFNPRTRVGCDGLSEFTTRMRSMFQSTHPRGVRLTESLLQYNNKYCFNPRTRVGCDYGIPSDSQTWSVSIHAPAWGATDSLFLTCIFIAVSIHAPAWGATPTENQPTMHSMFQSTHPRGVRPLNAIKNYIESKFQSTHPRGVRHGIFSMLHWGLCFNPRTRVGCDLLVRATPTATDSFNPRTRVGCDGLSEFTTRMRSMFQSTHPRGVRLTESLLQYNNKYCFNPRTRVGCDYASPSDSQPWSVSIHAPAWGATNYRQCVRRIAGYVSIHAPAWGATYGYRSRLSSSGFQSTHPRGVRRLLDGFGNIIIRFQSTHPRGVRLKEILRLASNELFQSTHPRGVRLLFSRTARLLSTVSIHAPAWGATDKFSRTTIHLLRFNPRTRVGCDVSASIFLTVGRSFNPRTRVGCDTKTFGKCRTTMFQSTHPRGVRHTVLRLKTDTVTVSIHAPAWGATSGWRWLTWRHRSFNPRTRVGCDPRIAFNDNRRLCFNPRTRVGCDQ